MRVLLRVSVALALRALRDAAKRPQFIFPLVMFPSLFLAVNTGGLSNSTKLDGFPHVDSFLQFQLPAAITQSLLIGGVATGIASALEIESGFFDRLVAAPIPRAAIVVGRLMSAGVISAVQVVYFLLLGLLFGAKISGGVTGVLCILAIGVVAGIGFGAIGQAIALRARNVSTVQGIFPLVFVILFLSEAFFPQELLDSPVDTIAKYNPLSFIADGMRDPLISDVSARPVLEGLAASAGVVIVCGWLSLVALRGRLRDA